MGINPPELTIQCCDRDTVNCRELCSPLHITLFAHYQNGFVVLLICRKKHPGRETAMGALKLVLVLTGVNIALVGCFILIALRDLITSAEQVVTAVGAVLSFAGALVAPAGRI